MAECARDADAIGLKYRSDGTIQDLEVSAAGIGDVRDDSDQSASGGSRRGGIVQLTQQRYGAAFGFLLADSGVSEPGHERPPGLSEGHVFIADLYEIRGTSSFEI